MSQNRDPVQQKVSESRSHPIGSLRIEIPSSRSSQNKKNKKIKNKKKIKIKNKNKKNQKMEIEKQKNKNKNKKIKIIFFLRKKFHGKVCSCEQEHFLENLEKFVPGSKSIFWKIWKSLFLGPRAFSVYPVRGTSAAVKTMGFAVLPVAHRESRLQTSPQRETGPLLKCS